MAAGIVHRVDQTEEERDELGSRVTLVHPTIWPGLLLATCRPADRPWVRSCDRGECDHDHEQVEQQCHARGKPDVDIAGLSKEHSREEWNQAGVATTERGEQRGRDRHAESGTQGRGHFVDAGRGPSFVIRDIRKRGVRRRCGVEAETDTEKGETDESDKHVLTGEKECTARQKDSASL